MVRSQRVKVYEALCALYARRLMYVSIRRVAARANVPVSTASYELSNLEKRRVVVRRGRRGGWRPVYKYQKLYTTLRDLYRRSHDFVRSYIVADVLGIPYSTVWGNLKRLKDSGLVVAGKSGWIPARRIEVSVSEQILVALSGVVGFAKTRVLAADLGISSEYARRLLNQHEADGYVVRRGQRGGWRLARPADLLASA